MAMRSNETTSCLFQRGRNRSQRGGEWASRLTRQCATDNHGAHDDVQRPQFGSGIHPPLEWVTTGSRDDKSVSLLGAVEYAPVFGPVMHFQEFDERLPVVGQRQQRLREPGGRCLTAGNGRTWSGRPYAGPSWMWSPRHGRFKLNFVVSYRSGFLESE